MYCIFYNLNFLLFIVDEKDEVSIKNAAEMIVEAMKFKYGLEVTLSNTLRDLVI